MKNSKIENLLYAKIENEKLKYLLGGTGEDDVEDDGDDMSMDDGDDV